MTPFNTMHTPSSSTASATIDNTGGMAAPAMKLFVFQNHDDKGFHCINQPGLPIAEVPQFDSLTFGNVTNALLLPAQFHTGLAEAVEQLNHGVADGSPGWVLKVIGEYPGTTDGYTSYAAIVEQNGATVVHPAALVPAKGDDIGLKPPKAASVDSWGNDITTTGDNGWGAVNHEGGGTSCNCNCNNGWACDGGCLDDEDNYYENEGSENGFDRWNNPRGCYWGCQWCEGGCHRDGDGDAARDSECGREGEDWGKSGNSGWGDSRSRADEDSKQSVGKGKSGWWS